jgi:putative addiction module killer protein
LLTLHEFLDAGGRSPFRAWFDALDPAAAARIAVALARIGQGNLSNVRGVGEGVLEYRIHAGPGYRVYFGRDGAVLVILLGGGTAAATGYRRREDPLDGLQAPQAGTLRNPCP